MDAVKLSKIQPGRPYLALDWDEDDDTPRWVPVEIVNLHPSTVEIGKILVRDLVNGNEFSVHGTREYNGEIEFKVHGQAQLIEVSREWAEKRLKEIDASLKDMRKEREVIGSLFLMNYDRV